MPDLSWQIRDPIYFLTPIFLNTKNFTNPFECTVILVETVHGREATSYGIFFCKFEIIREKSWVVNDRWIDSQAKKKY